MAKFIKRPITIDAMPWDGVSGEEMLAWAASLSDGNGTSVRFERNDHGNNLSIHTLEGVMQVRTGDWVICGVEGEFYPCRDDIFRKTYYLVAEEEC